jgi:ATP-dependent Clp protease ATP-binding subunit ClpC
MIPVRGSLTDRTRKVLDIAHDLAMRLGHEAVLPEHIAIGLLREGEGVAFAVLFNRGVPLEPLERELEAYLSRAAFPGGKEVGEVAWAPASLRALEQLSMESKDLGHPYIGTEHLLLALLRDTSGVPAQVLRRYGLGVDDARAEVLKVLTF